MTASYTERLAKHVMDGGLVGRDEAAVLAGIGQEQLPELLHWANRIRERFFSRLVSFCCIAPGRLGGCGEDCAWCGQSARYVDNVSFSRPMDADVLLEAAKKARRAQASCFCIVNPGRRPTEQDLKALEETNRRLAAEALTPACASLGELDDATARRLRQAGVTRYNHNLETSRQHFARVVTTHTYDDRLRTLQAAKSAGMALCCGGIFGIGETRDDRIDLAMTLRDQVAPDVVPLNFHDPRPGTPLEDAAPLKPLECLHIIAVFRLILPTTNIKIAGGKRLLGDLQSWVFHAGATSLMVGDYLTTCGRDAEIDRRMVEDLGLTLTATHEECHDVR